MRRIYSIMMVMLTWTCVGILQAGGMNQVGEEGKKDAADVLGTILTEKAAERIKTGLHLSTKEEQSLVSEALKLAPKYTGDDKRTIVSVLYLFPPTKLDTASEAHSIVSEDKKSAITMIKMPLGQPDELLGVITIVESEGDSLSVKKYRFRNEAKKGWVTVSDANPK